MNDIVLVTEDRFEDPRADPQGKQVFVEEGLLSAAFERRGARVRRVAWSNRAFDWSQASVALVQSTWDYIHRLPEFRDWLQRTAAVTRLLNPAELILWNSDKRYLLELERAGIRIPRTRVVPAGSDLSLAALFDELRQEELVFKPAVSLGARDTHRVHRDALPEAGRTFAELTRREAVVVQEFLPDVLVAGEVSVVLLGGRASHAVRKIGRAGDFRVQDHFGGRVEPHAPTEAERAFAERVVAACPVAPVYARIDLVRHPDGGLCLMEAELIEPELFFRLHPAGADRLAEAVERWDAVPSR